jgi:hypothetical protein
LITIEWQTHQSNAAIARNIFFANSKSYPTQQWLNNNKISFLLSCFDRRLLIC